MRLPVLLSAALLAALTLACPAQAAPSLDGINLGSHVAGPKITAQDLKRRVVVFEYWGVNCPPCKQAIPHLAEIQNKYPYQNLIIVANQCQGGGTPNAAKVWKENKGGEKVAVRDGGDLAGANVTGIPRVFVFNAMGKCVFDGNPLDAKFANAVDAAVKASPGGIAALKRAEAMQDRLKAVFGKTAAPEDFLPVVVPMADTTRSSALGWQQLERASRAKDPKYSEPAKKLLSAFQTCAATAYDKAVNAAETSPAEAWREMESLTVWVPQLEEGAKAQKQLALWRRDGAFLKELAADKAWLALKAQADKIGFEKNPRATPTHQLEVDYRRLLKDKDLAATQGLARAKAAAESWKIDPETGRIDKFKPAAKQVKSDAPARAADPAFPKDAPQPAAAAAEENADAQKSVLGN